MAGQAFRPRAGTLRVEGYREIMEACADGQKNSKKFVRDALRQVGDVVRLDASRRIAGVSSRTAVGYKTSVTTRRVGVYQSLKKTAFPGYRRPKFGGYQMTHSLMPALAQNTDRLMSELETQVDRICTHFESTP